MSYHPNAMMTLKKSIVLVGPDRCWKSTTCAELARWFNVPIHAGKRGSERATGTELFHGTPKVFDRGIVCARAYDVLLQRPARNEVDYIYAEAMMRRSGAVYVLLDRDDFSTVHDDENPHFDLGELSRIYALLLPLTCVPYARFTVDDDTGIDFIKLSKLTLSVIDFLSAMNALEEGEE